jgi:hypothetical protein
LSTLKLPEVYIGKKLTIKHCKNAIKTFSKALTHVEPRKQLKFTGQIISQIKKIADEGDGAISLQNFPWEGKLPKQSKRFRALKRIPIRGYCWCSDLHPNTYFISHYIYKDFDKLDPSDEKKVCNNWTRIEENLDEC